jgi:predicted small metal-binding protein
MKEFSCGAVVPDCTATFRADSEDDLLQQVAVHARRAAWTRSRPR